MPTLLNVDLDGDGRDELLFHDGGRLRACRGDLKEQWSRPTRETIREVIPASTGRPATVVLNPSLGLDGATGRPIWSGGPARSILRASDDNSLPRVLTGPDGYDGLPRGHADLGRRDLSSRTGSAGQARGAYVTIRAGSDRSPGFARLSRMQTRSCKWPWPRR